jgi:molybdate transport system ATP-binding protein
MSKPALNASFRLRAGGFTVEVSLDVGPGVTILFGPSGSGKSSTLAALAGLSKPESGRIALGDEVWFDAERGVNRPPHERGVAFVFQSLALFPHMTALANAEYGIARSVPRADRLARAKEMLDRMRVGHLADRKPSTFSGGEAQRVALARAFARAPSLILLDEPFSALDRALKKDLCTDVKRAIRGLGVPALVVTHHPNEARFLGDSAIGMDAGRVRCVGSVEEVVSLELAPASSEARPHDFADTPLDAAAELLT